MFAQWWFLTLFLPTAVAGYWLLNAYYTRYSSMVWILACSIVFYGLVAWQYVPLMVASITGTFLLSTYLGVGNRYERWILALGIVGNLGLLAYFKYTDFFIASWGSLMGKDYDLLQLMLPLGLSFTVFQQITFLMDNYRQKTTERSLCHYSTYVFFFPQVIAGPIVHHQYMMSQFDDVKNHVFRWAVFMQGLALFTLGATKKFVLADSIGQVVNQGWDQLDALSQSGAWLINGLYALQIYFDFSGYTLMALGIGLFFGIQLPHNFNQPYLARSVSDFWRRWHITLSRFLRDYVYIPLGGNRGSRLNTYGNIMVTFLVSGLWHGAGWTFVVWGALHGLAIALEKAATSLKLSLHRWLGWALTLVFLYFTWVLFRADSFAQAWAMWQTLLGLVPESFFSPQPLPLAELLRQSALSNGLLQLNYWAGLLTLSALAVSVYDSPQVLGWEKQKVNWLLLCCLICLAIYGLYFYTDTPTTYFIYGSF